MPPIAYKEPNKRQMKELTYQNRGLFSLNVDFKHRNANS